MIGYSLMVACLSGCNLVPDFKHKPQYHNPFPQITKVAVLPFRNQSQEPTISGARVSLAYFNELQSISGFEVLPVGVVESQLAFFEMQVLQHPLSTPEDFQKFAQHLGVDAVLQGAITDYDAYYPPRMALKVNWYAANPGFHPIPVGYGLPWGTKAEKKIPQWIRLESERALAAEQLKTQVPVNSDRNPNEGMEEERSSEVRERINVKKREQPNSSTDEQSDDESVPKATENTKPNRVASSRILLPVSEKDMPSQLETVVSDRDRNATKPRSLLVSQKKEFESVTAEQMVAPGVNNETINVIDDEPPYDSAYAVTEGQELPRDWPDPQGFIPSRPSTEPPKMIAQYEPIISHYRTYNGSDEDFTQALGEYYYYRDDARFGGWQSYLQRSEDFIRFCCYQHIVETLASRGGQLESRMILRWPINRYER